MIEEVSTVELSSVVEMVAREVLWEAGVDHPPVDAIDIAERLGCCVVAAGSCAGRASRVALRGGANNAILLSPEDRPERRQWCVAHELGELLSERVFDRLGVAPAEAAPDAREQLANRFASCLLLPRRWFLPDGWQSDWDLLLLKQRYRTASHELIARRVLELHAGLIAVSVIDNGQQTWRRSPAHRPPPPCPAELESWKTAHETGEPITLQTRVDGVLRVRVWPVHEPDWKREILITEFEEAA